MLNRFLENLSDDVAEIAFPLQGRIDAGESNLERYPLFIRFLATNIFSIVKWLSSALQWMVDTLANIMRYLVLTIMALLSTFTIDFLVYIHSGKQHEAGKFFEIMNNPYPLSSLHWYMQVCRSLNSMFTGQEVSSAVIFIPRLLTIIPLAVLALIPVIVEAWVNLSYLAIKMVTHLTKNLPQLAALAVLNAPLVVFDAGSALCRIIKNCFRPTPVDQPSIMRSRQEQPNSTTALPGNSSTPPFTLSATWEQNHSTSNTETTKTPPRSPRR